MNTPAEWIERIHQELSVEPSEYLVVDRFAGDGEALEVFRRLGYQVKGFTNLVDINKDFLIYGDGFSVKLEHDKVINFVNPPFEYYIFVVRKDIEMFSEINVYILDETIINNPHMKVFFEHVEMREHRYIEISETYKILILYA